MYLYTGTAMVSIESKIAIPQQSHGHGSPVSSIRAQLIAVLGKKHHAVQRMLQLPLNGSGLRIANVIRRDIRR